MLRHKFLFKDDFNWKNIEFLRDTRSHPAVMDRVFHYKKITRSEQEDWFENVYCATKDYFIWISYDEKISSPVGYIQAKVDNIIHQRANLGIIVNPEFYGLGYESHMIKWFINNIGKVRCPIHKIITEVLDDDEDLMNIFSKAGFEADACLRDHIYKQNIWKNVIQMSYLI